MKIALAQIDCEIGNVAANLEQMESFAQHAANAGCQLIAFPEMSDIGYHMPTIRSLATTWFLDEAHNELDPECPAGHLADVAQSLKIHMVAGLAERTASGDIHNSLAAFDSSGWLVGRYRKIHLIGREPFLEDQTITAGTSPFVDELAGWRTGLMTCYDIRFPELGRALAARGAKLLIVSAAWPEVRIEHWKQLAIARAIENQCYVAAVNRVGVDDGTKLGGCSQVIDPLGNVVASFDCDQGGLLIADLELEQVDAFRSSLKAQEDRRPDLYASWL